MQNAQNYKFLNKSPMILGFEFFDCVLAVIISMFIFLITSSHFLALVFGFAIVILKSAYKKLYPKNTVYFWKNKKDGVGIKFHIKSKVNIEDVSATAPASRVHTGRPDHNGDRA